MTTALNTKKLTYEIEKTGLHVPDQIRKRDGSISKFDAKRIAAAVDSCLAEVETPTILNGSLVATAVTRTLSARGQTFPSVEEIQDAVVDVMYAAGEYEIANRYQNYRHIHKHERDTRPIPQDVRDAFETDKEYFPTAAQQFMFYDKYSRYNHELGRRETWVETVDRTVEHLMWLTENHSESAHLAFIAGNVYDRIRSGILNMEVMPSMRMLAMAGPAARRNGLALYNCSYLPVKDTQTFVEALLISMAGCGVGFSVESQYVEQLPRIKRQRKNQEVSTHFIEDTTEGWGKALEVGLDAWVNGYDVEFDDSGVRPKGSVLLTKGGRASGPEPLMKSLATLKATILKRQGKYLTPADCHLMMCAVGEAAVAGGVRRTAMISLFDSDDTEMRNIKNGPNVNPLLWNANNSAVWDDEISDLEIIEQMTEMMRAGSGEPGIFSRANANRTRPARRSKAEFGTNPCGEINLRPYGLCNLSIAVVRPDDNFQKLKNKVELAAIIGTIQSLSTNFPGMRPEWKKNCEEERLLGVDLAGQLDNPLLSEVSSYGEDIRKRLQDHAVEVNARYAEILGINPAAATTCNKPGGNSGELLDTPSGGLGARHSEFYRRNMRISASGPLFKVLRSAGVPMDPENGQTVDNATTWVVHFPKKSPEGAITKQGRTALEQMEFWLLNKQHWTEHNPSCTITYQEHEIMDVIQWVVSRKDLIGGLSFLPAVNTVYDQMPYVELTKEEYEAEVAKFPTDIDYSKIYRYELDDMTTASRELSCFAGSCEI